MIKRYSTIIILALLGVILFQNKDYLLNMVNGLKKDTPKEEQPNEEVEEPQAEPKTEKTKKK